MIFNDFADDAENLRNDEGMSKMKRTGISVANTILCKLNGNNGLERSFLFGVPEKGTSTFSYLNFNCPDYNNATNTYAVIIIERDGRRKEGKIAWITFE